MRARNAKLFITIGTYLRQRLRYAYQLFPRARRAVDGVLPA
jgi:hypothetical protein